MLTLAVALVPWRGHQGAGDRSKSKQMGDSQLRERIPETVTDDGDSRGREGMAANRVAPHLGNPTAQWQNEKNNHTSKGANGWSPQKRRTEGRTHVTRCPLNPWEGKSRHREQSFVWVELFPCLCSPCLAAP